MQVKSQLAHSMNMDKIVYSFLQLFSDYCRVAAAVFVMAILLAILVTVAVVGTPVTGKKWSPLIRTEGGLVSGISEKSTKGNTFYSYYSIPFAKPPVNELRFKVLCSHFL